MELNNLSPAPGSRREIKRKGRGPGSGHGSTACRGDKGQRSRAGGRTRRSFEGGQMPLARRLPKRGFSNYRSDLIYAVLNVSRLEIFDNGTEITIELLRDRHLVSGKYDCVKILGVGVLTKSLTVKVHAFSAQAKSKIEAAGGQAVLI
jgi:large subunit ribosomal protein L15